MFWQVLFDPVCDLIQLLGDLYLRYLLSRLEPLAQDYSPWEGRKKVYQSLQFYLCAGKGLFFKSESKYYKKNSLSELYVLLWKTKWR